MTHTAPPPPAFRRWEILRAAAVFLAALGGFALLLEWSVVERGIVEPVTRLEAIVAGGLLRAFGLEVVVRGTSLVARGFAINILNGCNGVYAISIYLAAVLAYPSRWRERAAGAGLGTLLLLLVNLIRILSLFLIGLFLPDRLEWFHVYFWQTGIVVASLLTWFWWEARWVRHA